VPYVRRRRGAGSALQELGLQAPAASRVADRLLQQRVRGGRRMSTEESMAGSVADRIGCFRSNVRPLLWALEALVRDGVWSAEMIVDAGFFAGSPLDKKGTRAEKIRGMHALIRIVTLPEAHN
jgi:hypothetical protein